MKKYANKILYTDIIPYEVVKYTKKTITIRELAVERDPNWKPEIIVGGFAGHCINQDEQKWIYKTDEHMPLIRAYLHKDGCYYNRGDRYRLSDKPVYYYDYNF